MSATDNGGTDRIIWVDCEMTGLDIGRDALIEVAVVVTDSQLNVLGNGIDVIIAPPPEAISQMGQFVREMHTASGLLDALAGGMSLDAAQAAVMNYLRAWVPQAGKAPLAGNSVSTDRTFIDRDMPELSGHLHYRTIDVSSVKELARRWYPRVYFHSPTKNGGHRALADILDSIDELRYYRAALFAPDPGPTSDEVKAIAAQIIETTVRNQVDSSAVQ